MISTKSSPHVALASQCGKLILRAAGVIGKGTRACGRCLRVRTKMLEVLRVPLEAGETGERKAPPTRKGISASFSRVITRTVERLRQIVRIVI